MAGRTIVHHERGRTDMAVFDAVAGRCGTTARTHGYVRASGDVSKVTCLFCRRAIDHDA